MEKQKTKNEELQTLYFKDKDSDMCMTLWDFIVDAEEEIEKVTLFKAIKDNGRSGLVWCREYGEVEKQDCVKSQCRLYHANKSGRGTCIHRGALYLKGEEVEIEVSEYRRLINKKNGKAENTDTNRKE